MRKVREAFSLAVLTAVYLLMSFRYYPGRLAASVQETLFHMLEMAPYTIGTTILIVSFFRRLQGEKLPWDRMARIFLTLGVIFEFFIGLYHYLEQGVG